MIPAGEEVTVPVPFPSLLTARVNRTALIVKMNGTESVDERFASKAAPVFVTVQEVPS